MIVVGVRGAKINGGDEAIVECAGWSIGSSKRRRASDVATKNRKGLLSSRSSPLQRTVRYRVGTMIGYETADVVKRRVAGAGYATDEGIGQDKPVGPAAKIRNRSMSSSIR